MEKITFKNQEFSFVKAREYMRNYKIYKNDQYILRVGNENDIKKEINHITNLIKNGFQVPNIIENGKFENNFYILEENIGDSFIEVFKKEYEDKGKISDKSFFDFLEIVKSFANAQMKTIDKNILEISKNKDLKDLIDELPHKKDDILKCYKLYESNMKNLPFVFTHGDFNVFNIHKNGVIDFEYSRIDKLGLDIIGNIISTYFFPIDKKYERYRLYDFTREQIDKYLQEIDILLKEKGVSDIKKYINDIIFHKTIFATVHMHSTPKLQKYRYDMFDKIIELRKENSDLLDFILEYR